MTNKEAINLLDNLIGMIEDNQNSDYDKALHMGINSLKAEPDWIPCSERMPEYYDWYLVSNKETSWVALWQDGVFLSVSGYLEFSDIIAWMPLPEPFKGGK